MIAIAQLQKHSNNGVDPRTSKVWTIRHNREHTFAYWDTPICDAYPCDPNIKVSTRVIAFLDQYLKTP